MDKNSNATQNIAKTALQLHKYQQKKNLHEFSKHYMSRSVSNCYCKIVSLTMK